MFESGLLKRASVITKHELEDVLRTFETHHEVNGQYVEEEGPMGYLVTLKTYLESRGVVFSEELSGEIYAVSDQVTSLGKYILGLMVDEEMIAYGTSTYLPEFECSDGVFIYPRLEVLRMFDVSFEGDQAGKPESSVVDLDDEEILERHRLKKDNKW